MTRTRSWLSLAFVIGGLGTLTASCGSDELTKSDDDVGAGAGRGGAGGAGGSAGTAGRAGSGGSAPTSNLGKACGEGTSCGTGLECLAGEVLPGGLCTAECTTNAQCEALGPLGSCLEGLCYEGCTTGATLGLKCHGRSDMVCQVYDAPEGGTCTLDADCNPGELCLGGTCLEPLTACVPSCSTDADCGEGTFCSLEFGSCVDERPQGLPVGSPCDPDLEPEDDPCEGFCIGSSDGLAFCSGWCRMSWETGSPSCGSDATTEFADAACLWVSALQPDADEGDAGFCGKLCDCTADCLNPDLTCVAWQPGMEGTLFGRRGYCVTPEATDEVLDDCSGAGGASGEGGAGGASGGGAGGAGAGGGGAGGTSGAGSAGEAQGGEGAMSGDTGSAGAPAVEAGAGGTTG